MASTPGNRPPRRSAGSRSPSSRPKKLAGHSPSPVEERVDEPVEEPFEEPAGVDRAIEPVEAVEPGAPPVEDEPPGPEPDTTVEEAPGRGRRTTSLLAAVVVTLALVAGGEGWYLLHDDAPTVSSSRPVVVSPLTAEGAVDVAAKAAVDFVSASYDTFDDDVDTAAAEMTSGFATKYRETKADIKDAFVAAKTKVSAEVSAQGVISASEEQVQALLFLTQSTTKDDTDLTAVQYRIVVTLIADGDGWLVSDVDTI